MIDASHPTVLTHRETQILQLLAVGRTVVEIAADLQLGRSTIRSYKDRLTEKLGTRNDTHTVIVALQRGLLDLP